MLLFKLQIMIYNELLLKKEADFQIRIITSDKPSNVYLFDNLCANFSVVKILM